MDLPDGFVHVREAGAEVVARADLAATPTEAWWERGVPLAEAKGRGGVVCARIGPVDVVLRTYRRGGALRRALPDAFRSPERAFLELSALAELGARGVPTVEPIAAAARRRGLLWELRLATVRVERALPLPAFVAAHPGLRRAAVREAARVVGAAFDAGLRHPDLHPDNLIARAAVESRVGTEVEVLLLDLDRATVGGAADLAARDAMLVRMARYLLRHRGRLPVVPSWTDLLRFLAGLGYDRPARRAAVVRLGAELARQAARRRLPIHEPPRAL